MTRRPTNLKISRISGRRKKKSLNKCHSSSRSTIAFARRLRPKRSVYRRKTRSSTPTTMCSKSTSSTLSRTFKIARFQTSRDLMSRLLNSEAKSRRRIRRSTNRASRSLTLKTNYANRSLRLSELMSRKHSKMMLRGSCRGNLTASMLKICN